MHANVIVTNNVSSHTAWTYLKGK